MGDSAPQAKEWAVNPVIFCRDDNDEVVARPIQITVGLGLRLPETQPRKGKPEMQRGEPECSQP